jgi:two-component system OmpR family response regulator
MNRTATSRRTQPRLLPHALAWVGANGRPVAGLADVVTRFDDSDDFLLAPTAFEFDFYVVCLAQRGVPGLDLLRLIRKRTAAGVVALGDGPGGSLALALDSGADMVLPAKLSADDLCAAIAAVHRRALGAQVQRPTGPWTLIETNATLRAPDGAEIALSASDLALLQCFAESSDGKVDRAALVERLWGERAGDMENALHATVYRLRKRIEQAGHASAPVHALAKVGYEFRAPLVKA